MAICRIFSGVCGADIAKRYQCGFIHHVMAKTQNQLESLKMKLLLRSSSFRDILMCNIPTDHPTSVHKNPPFCPTNWHFEPFLKPISEYGIWQVCKCVSKYKVQCEHATYGDRPCYLTAMKLATLNWCTQVQKMVTGMRCGCWKIEWWSWREQRCAICYDSEQVKAPKHIGDSVGMEKAELLINKLLMKLCKEPSGFRLRNKLLFDSINNRTFIWEMLGK